MSAAEDWGSNICGNLLRRVCGCNCIGADVAERCVRTVMDWQSSVLLTAHTVNPTSHNTHIIVSYKTETLSQNEFHILYLNISSPKACVNGNVSFLTGWHSLFDAVLSKS